MDVIPVVAQFFRAEFVQAPWTDPRAVGPRIQELDGFDTFLGGGTGQVPEPSTFILWSLGAITLVGLGWRRRKWAA